MKWIVIILVSGLAVFGIVKKNNNTHTTNSSKTSYSSFAVLELFTSEGCSSCPPADRLLPQFANENSNIIPLSFHVDYWNNLGWKDPFSNSIFSDRQKEYARQFKLESIYTPELVINGKYELIGSDKTSADADIKKSLGENGTVKLTIDEVKNDNGKLSVDCPLEGSWQGTDLLVALVQK
ncbi:MAG TPA: DUF1223 domain-containing protein, partial [Chitinophagaceae bacterium]